MDAFIGTGVTVYVVSLTADEQGYWHTKPVISRETVFGVPRQPENKERRLVWRTIDGKKVFGVMAGSGAIHIDPSVPAEKCVSWPLQWFRTAEGAGNFARRLRPSPKAGYELVPAATHDEVKHRLVGLSLRACRIPVSRAVADSFRIVDYLDFVHVGSHEETCGQGDFRKFPHLEGPQLVRESDPERFLVCTGRLGDSAYYEVLGALRAAGKRG